ncbi:pilus assembly protein PilM [Myxococcota bacterium]|nr:pilus assembly protein PilM [Myxococcota bacterium]
MPILKNVVGLDLGTYRTKTIELRQTFRGLEVVQLRSTEVGSTHAEIPDALRQQTQQYNLPTDQIVAAIPGDRVSFRRLTLPFRERKKIDQAVPFEIANDVPFETEDLMLEWERVAGDRNHSNVVVSIAPRTEVSSILELLAEAECSPRTLEVEGLLLGNLSALFELPGTRLLADLGHRKTTLCILIDEKPIATRTVTHGGEELTNAIASDLGIPFAEAERVKHETRIVEPGFSDEYPRTAAALDRICREIVRTLASLEDTLGENTVEAITLFGGTAHLEGIESYFSDHIGIPAEKLGYPPEGKDAGIVAAGDPITFAPTIALGLRGTAQSLTGANFRQDEFAVKLDLGRFGREFALTGSLTAVALVLAIASFATSTAMASRRATNLETEIQRLYADAIPNASVPANPAGALRQAVDDANERAEFLGVYRGNLSALDLLNEISNIVPDDLDILLEELSIDKQTVRMRVYATSFEAADRLGAELSKFGPFAQARIGSIETDRKRGGKRFNVTINMVSKESGQ